MIFRRPRYHLIDLMMVVILCGLIAGFARWFSISLSEIRRPAPIPRPGDPGATFLAFYVAFVAWFVAWVVIRLRRRVTGCRECGRRFVPPRKADPPVCPRCRRRSLGPSQLKREQRKHIRVAIILLLVFGGVVGLSLSGWARSHFGGWSWVALPVISIGAVLGSVSLMILALVAFSHARARLLRGERQALAHARKAAGDAGQVVSAGGITAWYSGPTDPVPMLLEQREAVCRRFEAKLGESIGESPPALVLVFHRRDALVAYHRQALTDLWNLDGIYLYAPWRTLTLSAEAVPHRLTDTGRTARMLFGYHLLESRAGSRPRPWLQQGLVNAVVGGDDDELARLNRKMVASLARGTALGPDLFGLGTASIPGLLRGWYDHGPFSKLTQITCQSWSVVEYLLGDGAPEGRREQFRAFLKEIRPKEPDEPVFELHFGHGFGRLLEIWRAWVQDQGLGVHRPPPVEVREAILGRIVPIIRDRKARIMDRILAVRELGRVGYVVGADALIELLGDPGEIPKEEVVGSLESVSGLVLGDDPGRWRDWYSGLPGEVIGEVSEPAMSPTRKEHP